MLTKIKIKKYDDRLVTDVFGYCIWL
jgi:hypothetical protein